MQPLTRFYRLLDARRFFVASLTLVFALWVYSRFFNLEHTYLFISDAGRDAWTLAQWNDTGKIPFLGPGVSGIPMQASPVYFYILYPFFVLSQQSYFYSQIALFVYSWFFLVWTARIVFPTKNWRLPYALLVILLCASPVVVSQSRTVWNPSFLIPPVVTAFFLFLRSTSTTPHPGHAVGKDALLSGALLALASSLHFSAIPMGFAFAVGALITLRARALWWLAGFAGGVLLCFLPMIAFDLKHHFQITNRVIATLREGAVGTAGANPLSNLMFLSAAPTGTTQVFLLATSLMLFFSVILFTKVLRTTKRSTVNPRTLALSGLIITLVVSSIFPLRMELHYTFGVLFFLFAGIAFLPKPINLVLTGWLTLSWIATTFHIFPHQPALRTVSEFDSCMRSVREHISEPVYVTVQSGLHRYHEGQEFRYGLLRHGAEVKNITPGIAHARSMVVFTEYATYTHEKDSWYELTLFGSGTVVGTGECGPSLGWTIIQKK